MKKLLLLSLTVLLISSTGVKLNDLADDFKWKTYETENFSIDYPSQWKVVEADDGFIKFYIKSNLTSLKDKFVENVNLVTENLKDPYLSIDEYYDSASRLLKRTYKIKVYDETEGTINGFDYKEMTYFAKIGKLKLVLCQRSVVVDGTAYVLTFTFNKKTKEIYKKTKDIIFNSFIVKTKK